jgi:succinate dehydrogenase/fumarate reductase flavoprotein subunit
VADRNPVPASADAARPRPASAAPAADLRRELQDRCWESLGLERHAEGLAALAAWLEDVRTATRGAPADRAAAETRNLVEVALAMARSGAFRRESRGAHFRTDFPRRDDDRFRGHTLLGPDGVRLAGVEEPLTVSA